ncbi:hypothetical protein FVA74_11435 [Salinibacterium sp. dk2585]|uniref:cache domain-containing protein n=1 Tax=unclassified Salinibacterium TaxID=2632331 RepID=UPI0011C24D56|nr:MULTISPECIES: cache domain-containing protein [unclassified Salinibacterium]QEE62114.1 hypothetical protein FVA74_11435 [Salinibacterium sp. dk2585]TXK53466.1 hypothetical protein FVP63_09705 [Salinibacterium sp. dk5596]
MSGDGERRGGSGEGLVADIDAVVAIMRDDLHELAERALALRAEGHYGAEHVAAMVASLEPLCVDVLGRSRMVEGTGLVWSCEQADDSGMLWWRAEEGRVARKQHVFNPESDSYYNYLGSRWFRAARDSEGLAIVGPFIDAWGTDDHAITASLGLVHEGEFLGVVAADLNVVAVTDALAAALRPHGDVVLVDDEDRVVASNRPLLSPGLLLEPFLRRTGASVSERVATGVHGWFVARLEQG